MVEGESHVAEDLQMKTAPVQFLPMQDVSQMNLENTAPSVTRLTQDWQIYTRHN